MSLLVVSETMFSSHFYLGGTDAVTPKSLGDKSHVWQSITREPKADTCRICIEGQGISPSQAGSL